MDPEERRSEINRIRLRDRRRLKRHDGTRLLVPMNVVVVIVDHAKVGRPTYIPSTVRSPCSTCSMSARFNFPVASRMRDLSTARI